MFVVQAILNQGSLDRWLDYIQQAFREDQIGHSRNIICVMELYF